MDSEDLVKHLGFARGDRVVVLHADDIGMCHATIVAYRDMLAHGLISSASAMIPPGWFPALIAECLGRHEYDMGVHLTLTSEWRDYRWGPLLGAEAVALCDSMGYFHPRSEPLFCSELRGIVHAELTAQVLRARNLGLDISHLDTHMLTLLHPTLREVYADLTHAAEAPCVWLPFEHKSSKMPGAIADRRWDVTLAPSDGICFDMWAELPLHDSERRLEKAERMLEALPSGLSYFTCHPAADSPELRAIATDWEARVADFRLYTSDKWSAAVARSGVKIVGMRELRDVWRALAGEARAADGRRPGAVARES